MILIILNMLNALLLLINATRHATQIRQKKFEVFWYTHHLFVVYYVLFAGHGMQMVLGDFPMAWCFVIIPCILYGFERISRAVRYRLATPVACVPLLLLFKVALIVVTWAGRGETRGS
jgi:NADPH oxidase